jgi:hypothetical protein
MVKKKQQQTKTPNTLLSSQTTILLVSPSSGQPCQLNTDPAESSTPSFFAISVIAARAAVPG